MKNNLQHLLLGMLLLTSFLHAQNQFLVSSTRIDSFSKEELQALWKQNHINQFIAPVSNGVDVYEIIYNTRWHDGSAIKASGYVMVPFDGKVETFPTLIFNHGTKLQKEFTFKVKGLEAASMAFAADGYLVAFPHYIGLGKGDKNHLYQIAESEAFANIDMLRALREFSTELGVYSNGQLFITGYSQGGHATMATHKMIEEEYANEFQVAASSPMSGAYDMTGIQSQYMFQEYNHQAYLPYLILSLQEQYQIWPGDIYDVFKEPYKTIIKEKLNHNHNLHEVSKLLPKIPADMIIDSLVSEFRNNPDFILTKVLELNNNYDWKPESPMMLCYCNADEQVHYKNAFIAKEHMKANGAERILLRNGGKKYGHNKCAVFTIIYTKFFFDSIKNGNEEGSKGKLLKRFLVSLAKLKVKP